MNYSKTKWRKNHLTGNSWISSQYTLMQVPIYAMSAAALPGHIGRYLFNLGLNVYGIDISERCIELASIYNSEMKFQ